jgi:hypothetical protein
MVKADPDNWIMERTLADLYTGAGNVTERIANVASAGATGLAHSACPFFSRELSLWQDMRQRGLMITPDLPKLKNAEAKLNACSPAPQPAQ